MLGRDGIGLVLGCAGAETVGGSAGLVSEVGGRVGKESAGGRAKTRFFQNTKRDMGFLETAVTCRIVDSYIDTESLFHLDARLAPPKPFPCHKILTHLHPKTPVPLSKKKSRSLPMH